MDWFRAHALALTAAFAAILALAGFGIVRGRAPLPPRGITVWSGTEVAMPGLGARSPARLESNDAAAADLMQSVAQSAPFSYALPFSEILGAGASPVPTAAPGASAGQTFAQPMTSTAAGNAWLLDPYSFVPRGLIGTSTSRAARDAGQEALFEYGNTVGLEVRAFESAHGDTVAIIKDYFDDRTDAARATRVVGAGNDYAAFGKKLAALDSVPADASALHAAFAESYEAVGERMAALARAGSDKEAADAIRAYDTEAEGYLKAYVALVELFSARGVTFSPSDSGSIFTFTAQRL